MTAPATLTLPLADAEATARLGETLAPLLRPGDVVLLQGPIGAGKTHLARALIQARQAGAGLKPEDVPSPTFTLVQVYEAGGADIWHADLFRLGLPGEAEELGLTDAFETAICLIEWPERLGSDAPRHALRLSLALVGDARVATLTAEAPRWAEVLDALRQEQASAPAAAAAR